MKWINKMVDIPKLVRRLWIILWITLFIFVIAKLCFNLWYPIVIENEFIIKICEFIETRTYLKFIIGLVLYELSINIWYLTSTKRYKYTNKISLLILNVVYICNYTIKFKFGTIGNFIELLYIIVLPILYNLKYKTFNKRLWNVLLPIINYLAINLWQLNILFVRDINAILTSMPVLIQYVIQIDYYIFLIINWIGVNTFMGYLSGGWFFCKSTTELEAMKAEELTKKNPDAKLIADIDKELEKRKNEIKG